MTPTGHLDLFTSTSIGFPAAPATVRRQAPPLGPGEVRYDTFRGQRDCDDCWHAQATAKADGTPIPFRRKATSARRTPTTITYLCGPHKVSRWFDDRGAQR